MKRKLLGLPVWVWAAAGVVLIGGVLYIRKRNSTNAATAAAAASGGPAGTGTVPSTGYAASNYGAPDNNLPALGDILSQIAQTQAPTTTTTSSSAPSNVQPLGSEVIAGPGYSLSGGSGPGGAYGSGTVQGNDGNYYSTVSTLQAAQALFAGGTPVYVQPAEGSFTPVTSQQQFDQFFTNGGATTWVQVPPNSQAAAA